jgi:hypothetical protein
MGPHREVPPAAPNGTKGSMEVASNATKRDSAGDITQKSGERSNRSYLAVFSAGLAESAAGLADLGSSFSEAELMQ